MNLPLHEESFVPCLFSRGITREIDLQCFHAGAKEEPMKGVHPGRCPRRSAQRSKEKCTKILKAKCAKEHKAKCAKMHKEKMS